MTAEHHTVPHPQRWFGHLPLMLLAGCTVVALASGPFTGATRDPVRLGSQLALVAVTAVLLARRGDAHEPPTVAHYWLRTLLAAGLTLLNPLFCVFAWIGFADTPASWRGRRALVGIAATSVTMALGQSGGPPYQSLGHAAFFVVMISVNFGLAGAMTRHAEQLETTSEGRRRAIGELERANASLEAALAENAALHQTVIAQARVAGVQEERQRLAGEIHDTIAQSLAAALAQLTAAQASGPGGTPDAARVARATELTRAALVEARRSVAALVPTHLSVADLPEALDAVVREWARDHVPATTFVVTGDPRPLHPEVEATVLRVTQEALSNVGRHAAARRVGVTLSYDDGEVILDVRDDGSGYAISAPAKSSSFGLRGMRHRADRLAGELIVESSPGSGTALSLHLPALERGAA